MQLFFYQLLRLLLKPALKLFCASIRTTNLQYGSLNGPLLLVANHPNSFLDALVIGIHFKQPVYFLARGDFFEKPIYRKCLMRLFMIPVFRMRDGWGKLSLNQQAFNNATGVLAKKGIVLVFIEGISVNNNELQPFKKGAARIALACIKKNIPLKVLPIRINYDQFRNNGKNIFLHFGDLQKASDLLPDSNEAENYIHFNQRLYTQMDNMHPPSKKYYANGYFKKIWMVPAFIGYVLHAPLYYSVRSIVTGKTKNTAFFDAVLFLALYMTYPIYLILIYVLLMQFSVIGWLSIMIIALHPASAFLYLQWKKQQ